MLYDIEFSDLFKNKRQAVVLFLSLERRYMSIYKQLRELKKETRLIIKHGYIDYQQLKTDNKPLQRSGKARPAELIRYALMQGRGGAMGDSDTVTVCDKCLMASCWQGIFMCDAAYRAGTLEKTIEELKNLNLEHPSYWENNERSVTADLKR